jgi:hypothetical protein
MFNFCPPGNNVHCPNSGRLASCYIAIASTHFNRLVPLVRLVLPNTIGAALELTLLPLPLEHAKH